MSDLRSDKPDYFKITSQEGALRQGSGIGRSEREGEEREESKQERKGRDEARMKGKEISKKRCSGNEKRVMSVNKEGESRSGVRLGWNSRERM